MCRSIKPLRKYDQVATEEEVRAAARQFVRKVSGFHRPTAKHAAPFEQAVDEIAAITERVLRELAANVAKGPRGERDGPARRAPSHVGRAAAPHDAASSTAPATAF